MPERLSHSISRKLTVAIVLVVVSVLGNAGAVLWSSDANEDARRDNCEKVAAAVEIVERVIVTATEPGGSIDLTRIAGFEQLDPATQVWVRNVAAATGGGEDRPNPRREALLALIPETEC